MGAAPAAAPIPPHPSPPRKRGSRASGTAVALDSRFRGNDNLKEGVDARVHRGKGIFAGQSVRPPSTMMVWPVIIAAPAHRKKITSAMSSGLQARFKGVFSID